MTKEKKKPPKQTFDISFLKRIIEHITKSIRTIVHQGSQNLVNNC